MLRLLKRNVVGLPSGCSIEEFMFHRGKPPEYVTATANGRKELTLDDLRDAYFRSQEKKLEATTLDGIRLHFDHLTRILGAKVQIPPMQRSMTSSGMWIGVPASGSTPTSTRKARREKQSDCQAEAKLQEPAAAEGREARQAKTPPVGRHDQEGDRQPAHRVELGTTPPRPDRGIPRHWPRPRQDRRRPLPFMTLGGGRATRVAGGDDPEQVWDCVYLRPDEIVELLEWVKARPVSPWVYPIFCFAAHTGARRSEIVRALPSDVDLAQ